MAYIIFYKHPGDILEVLDHQTKNYILKIKNLRLPLTSAVKMVHINMFQISFEAPSDRIQREFLLTTLGQMLHANEIYHFSL